MLILVVLSALRERVTLRGLNFADFTDFADLGKNAKLSPGEKFATGHPRN